MNNKATAEKFDEMIDILLQKNLQLANDIRNCPNDILISEATAIKIALENAQTLNNIFKG